MTRIRLSVRGWMVVILVMAVALSLRAVLLELSALIATFLTLVVHMMVALEYFGHRQGKRARWAAAAALGWGYFVVVSGIAVFHHHGWMVHLPTSSIVDIYQRPILSDLQRRGLWREYVSFSQLHQEYEHYFSLLGHCLFSLLSALCGYLAVRLLAYVFRGGNAGADPAPTFEQRADLLAAIQAADGLERIENLSPEDLDRCGIRPAPDAETDGGDEAQKPDGNSSPIDGFILST